MIIEKDTVVSIDYTLKDDAGEVIDASAQHGAPLDYLQGYQNIVPGLEEALEGKAAGDKVEVAIPPEKGYGARRDELVGELPRANFPEGQEIKPGMQFHAQTPEGVMALTVVEANDETVKVDGNHDLAGKTLHFSVEVKDVREANDEEKEHGHVKKEGGCCGGGGEGGHEHGGGGCGCQH